MSVKIDLTGKKFTRLTVIKEIGRSKRRDILWLCRCDCGKEKILPTRKLKSGEIRSCGCLRNDMVKDRFTTHGMTGSRTYRTWNAMNNRCKSKDESHRNYKDRGIGVCDRWKESFNSFFEDMGERPKWKTLDRINNDGNYEPSNCKWSTRSEQQRNRRSNKIFMHNGEEKCLTEWCEILGLSNKKVWNKLRYRDYTISELIQDEDINKTGY